MIRCQTGLVNSGTGQGDVQAPPLLNVIFNWCLEQAIDEKIISRGFTLQQRSCSRKPAKYLIDADFGDNLALLDNSEDGLQVPSATNLRINAEKTKALCVNKHHVQKPYPEHINN